MKVGFQFAINALLIFLILHIVGFHWDQVSYWVLLLLLTLLSLNCMILGNER